MKAISYNSPRELKEITDKLLEGYEKAVKMAKADLKKAGIPFTSTRYGVHINMDEVYDFKVPLMLTKKDWIKQVLEPSTAMRERYEKEAGVKVA